jgi:hypothetical protein
MAHPLAAQYAHLLSVDPSLRTKLDVDLVTVFVPALEAFDATDSSLPDADRWRLAAQALASP